jgi:hypothetical protein
VLVSAQVDSSPIAIEVAVTPLGSCTEMGVVLPASSSSPHFSAPVVRAVTELAKSTHAAALDPAGTGHRAGVMPSGSDRSRRRVAWQLHCDRG